MAIQRALRPTGGRADTLDRLSNCGGSALAIADPVRIRR